MKFADRDPPPRSENGWEPDVDTYYYYLSFLERYIEETKTIPLDLRKVYLVRAEYRYIKWLHNSVYLTPPTDIAFTWHAHMLSPRRYYEDKVRIDGYGLLHHELNLEQWHQSYATAETKVNKVEWKKFLGQEPYRLTPSNLLNAPYPTIKCIVCSDTITLEWKDYATWRTNPTCAVQCGKCDAMFTIKHVGKANMILDLKKNLLNDETIAMAGLMFTHYQGDTKIYPQPEAAFHIEAFAHKLKSLPFNSGIYTIEGLLYDEEEDEGNGAESCADVMDAIRSTYMCSPYRESSIDLLQAVNRLYKFAFRVIENMEWDIPNDIHKGISQYNQVLKALMKSKHAIPTIYADVFWHTRMMRQNHDSKFMNIDKAFNHDNLVPFNQVQRYTEMPSKEKKSHTAINEQHEYSKSSMFKGVFGLKSAKSEGMYDVSVHGAEDVEDFVVFDFPYTNANGEFSRVEGSQLGFIGTIGGENGQYLNRWIRTSTTLKGQPQYAEDPYYVTYSKVFPSKNGSQEPRPNSTEEPWFHWQKASIAWVYAKSKEEVENSIRRALEAAKSRDAPTPAKGYFTLYGSQDYIPVGEGF